MTPQFDYRMGVASAAIDIALSKLQHAELEAGYGTVEASRIHDAIEAIEKASYELDGFLRHQEAGE